MGSGDKPAGPAVVTDDDQPVPFSDRYEVVRHLATGGMAEVLLARPLPAIGQEPIVVKRILPRLAAQPEFIEMFQNEARVAALLQHPNIVRTYEFGTAENGYFIAMEYLDGVTTHELLQASLRRGEHLAYGHAIAILREVCAALHYAHELCDGEGKPLQIVHRDVSPQNVVLTRHGVVKLLDFGIAKSLANHIETGPTKLKGKLRYLSPEQCRGKCDRRSDVFAAGLLLYELTIGRRAYRAETADEVYARVAMARFDRPRMVRETYPQELEDIVCRALACAPEDRYQTAAAMQTALTHVAELLGLTSSVAERAAMVSEVQTEARVIAQVSAMPPPVLELAVAGTVEVDYNAETTDVDTPAVPAAPPRRER